MNDDRIYIYDTTLRDGAQTSGVDFSATDKQDVALMLDALGVDYVEAGWPGANPTDDEFFAALPALKKARFCAFGMTRRKGIAAAADVGLKKLAAQDTPAVCIVGKAWDFQVREALGVSLEENVAMIRESVAFLVAAGKEALLDAEHFFDGYKANRTYALSCLLAAYEAGARWIVLCDTNGGSLPDEISAAVRDVVASGVPGERLGVHCHNDTEHAVANSIAAVKAGVRQVQGTLNGLGERCGNANLTSIIPTLILKLRLNLGVTREELKGLTHVARGLDDRLNRPYSRYAPYVGTAAFAHKGGLHVSAVVRNPSCYEHVPPESVGNSRDILVSDQAGKANILARLKQFGFDADSYSSEQIDRVVRRVKREESEGYAYDAADAGFYLLALEELHERPSFFKLQNMRCTVERRRESHGRTSGYAEATTRLLIGEEEAFTAASGNGPVDALDKALKKALCGFYPSLKDVHLADYKVRILNPKAATGARTRVLIESGDPAGNRWTTVGVSSNIIDASYFALRDAFCYHLIRSGARGEG
jgi:2-isopropylmalate synthase